jgi:hypothetical protein
MFHMKMPATARAQRDNIRKEERMAVSPGHSADELARLHAAARGAYRPGDFATPFNHPDVRRPCTNAI